MFTFTLLTADWMKYENVIDKSVQNTGNIIKENKKLLAVLGHFK